MTAVLSTPAAEPPTPPPADVLSPALLFQLQRSAGNAAVSQLAQRSQAPGAAIDPSTMVAMAAFHAAVDAERARIGEQAAQRKRALADVAQETKRHIHAGAEVERRRALQAHQETIAQVHASMVNARAQVTGQRNAQTQKTDASAQQELAALQQVITTRQAELKTAGETKATSAEQLGEMQAQRALTGAQARATQARMLGPQKAAQYRGYKRAADIGDAAMKMAAEAGPEIVQAGEELAATARKDAGALAAKFRREAGDAARGFNDRAPAARNKIEEERTQTTSGLNRMAEQSLSHLESSGQQVIAQQQRSQQASQRSIQRLATGASNAIDHSVAAALGQVNETAEKAITELNNFEATVTSAMSRAWPWSARQQLEAARVQAVALGDGFVTNLDKVTGQLETGLRKGGQEAVQRVRAGVEHLIAPVHQAGTTFESNASKSAAEVDGKMAESAAQSAQNMRAAVAEVDQSLQKAIAQSEEKWQSQLEEGMAAINKKVDEGLAKQDAAVVGLAQKIDQKAQEIEHQSWLDRALQFVGGFVSGFFKELWNIVKGILIVALVVLAVVLVAALLIVLFAGLEALLAIVLAVVLFAAVYASVIGTVLAVVGAIAAVVMLAIAAYHVYEAMTAKDLTDWQRGELVGGAGADVASIVVPETLFGRLATAGRAARAVEGTEDAAQLARLRALVPDEAELERLVQLSGGDAGRLERLLAETGRDPARLERLLRATRGDDATLQRLLTETDGNAARLDDVLGANGSDVGKAEAFLQKTPAELLRDLMGPDKFEEYQEAIEAIKAEHPELAGIPDDQLIAIRGYTDEDYLMLNDALRNRDNKELERLKPYIETAVAGLKQLPSYQGTVFRGEPISTIGQYLGKEGQIIERSFFVSTDKVAGFKRDIELIIESTTGKEVDLISHYKGDETEVLFPPGSQFKVLKVLETAPGKFRVWLEDVSGG